jgi:peptidoglycan-N-acetylglucosamine deacetylase
MGDSILQGNKSNRSSNQRENENKHQFRRIAAALLLGFALFSVGFFAGAKIYQNSMPVSAQTLNIENSNTLLKPQISSNEMNKRENKADPGVVRDVDSKDNPTFNPYINDGKKIAYLTFDDGPSSSNTPKILDILKKNNIKATFFVIGNLAEENKALIVREHADGNAIGNHTYSHVYNRIYASPTAFFNEIKKGENVIKSILGDSYKSKLIRFPGGSFGLKLKPFRDEILKDGYHFVDWNALDGDAEGTNISPAKLFLRFKETVGTQPHVVVLMHDAYAKNTTVEILPQIIQYLKAQGYTFSTLK